MDVTWLVRGLVGGVLIGLSASVLLLMNGRIAGISGIVNGLMAPLAGETVWRALFVLGLLLGGAMAFVAVPSAASVSGAPSVVFAIAAGLLVGVGTRLANGCTSGHGVCGNSRLSARSIAATLTFIATGAVTVLALRVGGIVP